MVHLRTCHVVHDLQLLLHVGDALQALEPALEDGLARVLLARGLVHAAARGPELPRAQDLADIIKLHAWPQQAL